MTQLSQSIAQLLALPINISSFMAGQTNAPAFGAVQQLRSPSTKYGVTPGGTPLHVRYWSFGNADPVAIELVRKMAIPRSRHLHIRAQENITAVARQRMVETNRAQHQQRPQKMSRVNT